MWTKSTGIILIIIGIFMMAYTGFNYITTKNILNIGSVQINHTVEHPVMLLPYVGAVILAGGVILVDIGKKIHV